MNYAINDVNSSASNFRDTPPAYLGLFTSIFVFYFCLFVCLFHTKENDPALLASFAMSLCPGGPIL